jgi:DNA-directed RNA polymerase specialized sigma24 family protein
MTVPMPARSPEAIARKRQRQGDKRKVAARLDKAAARLTQWNKKQREYRYAMALYGAWKARQAMLAIRMPVFNLTVVEVLYDREIWDRPWYSYVPSFGDLKAVGSHVPKDKFPDSIVTKDGRGRRKKPESVEEAIEPDLAALEIDISHQGMAKTYADGDEYMLLLSIERLANVEYKSKLKRLHALDIEEAAYRTALELMAHLDTFNRKPEAFKPWVRGALRNKRIDLLRHYTIPSKRGKMKPANMRSWSNLAARYNYETGERESGGVDAISEAALPSSAYRQPRKEWYRGYETSLQQCRQRLAESIGSTRLPDYLVGTDRAVVEMIEDGLQIEDIAVVLGMTNEALQQRVGAIKRDIEEDF